MHILLTDILLCPRCVEESGLILLADRVERRRVLEGTLGCPTCRAQYAVTAGVADLRIGASAPQREAADAREPDARAMRWAALMGVTEGPGFLLLLGAAAQHAAAIAAMIEGVEVIAAVTRSDALSGNADADGVSRLLVDDRLPFYGGRINGVAVSGEQAAGPLLEEAARVVATGGRLVLEAAPAGAQARLTGAGLRVLAQQDDTVVAARG